MSRTIVLDTNIYISALLFKGSLIKVIQKADDEYSVCISDSLVDEVMKTLKNKFNVPNSIINELNVIFSGCDIYSPNNKVDLCRDPNDNFLLELCKSCDAEYLITGDKDLLVLEVFENTSIITPAMFLKY